jgi:hypothetical protein
LEDARDGVVKRKVELAGEGAAPLEVEATSRPARVASMRVGVDKVADYPTAQWGDWRSADDAPEYGLGKITEWWRRARLL